MAAIANAFAEQTTNQSTTSTTYGAVSGAQLPSSGFVAGQKYLILVGAQASRSLSSGNGGLRVAHGGAAFADSEWVFQPNLANTRLSYLYFTVWTAVADEAIDLEMKATTGTTNADQIVLFAMRLDADLTENTDWFYNANTTSNALGTTFEDGATVTFTPGTADRLWLLLHQHQATASAATSQGESRADLSGGTAGNWGLASEEGEDTAVDIHFHAFLRAISLPASSHTFKVQGRSETNGIFTHLRSAVFALDLGKFKDASQAFTATAAGYSSTSWASAVQTLSHTKTVDGNVLILAANVDDLAATTTTATHRLQVDNADQPGTQTSDIYPTSPTNNDSTDQAAWHLFTRESITANITVDHDGHSNVATTPTYSDRALVCFSMELAGATVFELDAAAGSYAVTGAAAGLVAGLVVSANPGSYSVTGSPAQFAIEDPATPGSYVLTGFAAGLIANYALEAAPGVYSLTGLLAQFDIDFPAGVGTYVYTGVVADLEHIIPGGQFSIDAQPGSYQVTGSLAGLVASYLLDAGPGSYSLTGQLAGFAIETPASPGVYAVAGAAAGLVAAYALAGDPGAYVLVGVPASVAIEMPGAAGVYVVTGLEAGLQFTAGSAFELNAEAGVYLVTGFADGAVIVQPVTGKAAYEVLQNGRRRVIVAKSGGTRRDV